MKITLTNFRCYKQSTTFEFIDVGSVLISGPSGKGKSSILMGIDFALYNKGGKNIIHYGETKCKVEFVFKDLKIVRTRNPSRLVVNDAYEDDIGQQIINNFFGKNFDVTGYISQNASDSFISKNPNTKRDFLESVKFENENLSEKKEKLEGIIKSTRQDLDKTIGKIEIARKMLLSEPTPVAFPIPKMKNKELAIKNENTNLKNAETRLKKATNKIHAIEVELQDLRVAQTYLNGKDENLSQICKQIEDMSLEASQYDFIGDAELLMKQKKLEILKANTTLLRLIHQKEEDELRLKNMKETEVNDIQKTIDGLRNSLWKEYSKEDTLSIIENNEDALKDINRIKTLKKGLNILKDIELLEKDKKDACDALEKTNQQIQSLKILVCPSCNKNLLLEDGALVLTTSFTERKGEEEDDEMALKRRRDQLTKKLKSLELDIFSYQDSVKRNKKIEEEITTIKDQYEEELDEAELSSDLSDIQAYYKSQISLENKMKDYQQRLEKGILSSSYNSYSRDFSSLCEKINTLQKKYPAFDDDKEEEEGKEENEDELRDFIEKENFKRNKLEGLSSSIKTQEKLKKHLMTQIEAYQTNYKEKYPVMADENNLLSELQNLKEEKEIIEGKLAGHTLCLKEIDNYLNYKKSLELYNKQTEMISELEEQEREESNKHTKAKMVKQDLLESEHIALSNTVKDINATANIFLQEFFEDPIFANLSCFKEDKKKNDKPQIYLDIKYKHMETSLVALSGGEYARVNLAFTLALAKIFNTPLLLLDETLSSLDEDIADVVFTSIKRHFNNIAVISILHQVSSEGDFDEVIKL